MYILQISRKAFIKDGEEITITPDYKNATQFNTIGEAMGRASTINSDLGHHIVRVIPF